MSTSADVVLSDLLGEPRAQVVELLRGTTRTVAQLAKALDVSEVAVRRHLQVLERDGLIRAETVKRAGPGRPSQHYALTDRAHRLFPDRSADLANELLDYLEESYGRKALLGFLRWRQARHGERYADVVADEGDILAGRVERLAGLLTEDGFLSTVTAVDVPDGATTLELRQEHCAIADVAAEHPEICAYEAAMFQRLLGANVTRRETIAGGAPACVCTIRTQDDTGAPDGHEG